MICKTPTEVMLHDALVMILRDLPTLECNDFHHSKKDQHKGYDCPVMNRFNAAVEHAAELLAKK